MKTKLSPILLPFIILLIGCDKNNNEPGNQTIGGKLINHSDCKSSYLKSTETGNNESCIEYSFYAAEEKLLIKHINAGFNCCPGELSCTVNFTGDTLVIEEFESEALCNCECLFDMDIEITGIETGKYDIRFIEPYCGDQKEIEFSMNLHQNPTGMYCVERNLYPWGI